MSAETTSSPPAMKRTFLRHRLPYVILGVALFAGLTVWFWPGDAFEPAQRNFSLILLAQLTVLLMLLWVIGFSGFRWIYRLAIVAAVIGLPYAAVERVRFTGDMVPSIEWRWESHDDALEAHRRRQASLDVTLELPQPTPGDFPEYRGADRDGRFKPLALEHPPSGEHKELWRQPCGGGYASFAVVGPLAVTIEQRRDREAVVAYDVKSGREAWVVDYDAHFREVLGGPGPRATPTIHDGHVYSLGATGRLVCLEAATGTPKWSADILTNNENVMWGMSGSPLVYDNLVVVNPGAQTPAAANRAVIAYERGTGREVWTSGNTRAGYASPMLATLCGKRQILIFDGEEIASYEAKDGVKLWSRPWITQQGINVAQPLVLDGDRVFISSGYGVGCAMLKVCQMNGQWSAIALWGDPASAAMHCKMSSPVYHEGHIYGLDEGFLACVDATTGKQKWREGRYGHGQILLSQGGSSTPPYLLILTETGRLVAVEARPDKHRELASFQAIEGKTWNYPAVADGRVFVRNHLEMACYGISGWPGW